MDTRNPVLGYYKNQRGGYPCGQGIELLAFISNPVALACLKHVINSGLYDLHESQLDAWEWEPKLMKEEYRELCRRSIFLERRYKHDQFRWPLEIVCPGMCRDTGVRILEYVAGATASFPMVKTRSSAAI